MVLTSKFSLRCSDLCSRKKPCLRLLQPHIQTAECTNQRKYRLPDYYNPERQNITSFGTTTNSFHIHQSYDFSSSFQAACMHLGTVLKRTAIETAPHGFFRQRTILIPGQGIQSSPLYLCCNPVSHTRKHCRG